MSDRLSQLARLTERIGRLAPPELDQVERFVTGLESAANARLAEHRVAPAAKQWPHAPLHRLHGKGTYLVTAGTLNKEHFFRDSQLLDLVEAELLAKAEAYRWHLEAWAVFSNHYHFVAQALDDAATLKQFLMHLHADTARLANQRDGQLGRRIWYNFWETELTYEKSYFARLNYVHQNPVKHGLVPVAHLYRWCSAAWFERTATVAQVKTIYSFKTDQVRVVDEYDVLAVIR